VVVGLKKVLLGQAKQEIPVAIGKSGGHTKQVLLLMLKLVPGGQD
jgi:hypothetical protein